MAGMNGIAKWIVRLMLLLTVVATAGGCRSRGDLVLLRPETTPVWRTVDTSAGAPQQAVRMVEVQTSMGRMVFELFERQAPASVDNFLQYVREGFYDGTIIHRVEPGLVIQGGGFTVDMRPKQTRAPIVNEAGNGLRNTRGTIGMARTNAMNSATSQFFINLVDNPYFNGDGVSSGYAVFGRVVDGMDVVDAIAMVETGTTGPYSAVPVIPVVIESIRLIE